MEILEFKVFESFFSSLDRKKRYLLGFSGGSDSMFLFLLLKYFNINFIAAHVDYGWREVSYQEALFLKNFSEKEKIPFKLHKAKEDVVISNNPEDNARKIRLKFFQDICKAEKLSGVFLAHHLDDQIETILKRCLEGTSLWNLRGLVQQNKIEDLTILRPLLIIHKKNILKFLEKSNIPYIRDETNFDLTYLRARFRLKIIPTLNEFFGKSFSNSLVRLSQSSDELLEFLEEESREFFECVKDSDEEISIDFSKKQPRSKFLWKFVIRRFFDFQRIKISQFTVETILDHCFKRSKNCFLRVDKFLILMHRGKLTLYKHPRSEI